MQKIKKESQVKDISDKIKKSKILILTDYRGLTVAQMTGIRRRIRSAGGEYKVLKNTLTRRALSECGLLESVNVPDGPLAVAFGYQDAVLAAKAVFESGKEFEKLIIKHGLLEQSSKLSQNEIKELAKLPPREVLLAQLFGQMKAPMSGLVYTLKGTINKLVYALEEVKKLKESKS
jgi:large subunit ribosomal protein L10